MQKRPVSIGTRISSSYGKALLISCLASVLLLLLNGVREYRYRWYIQANVDASSMAKNVETALKFNDVRVAKTFLATLSVNRSISSAAVYGKDGHLFASYVKDGVDTATAEDMTRHEGEDHFDFSRHECCKKILGNDGVDDSTEELGTLTIKYNASVFYSEFCESIAYLFVVFLLSYLSGTLYILKKKQELVEPILQLKEAAVDIAETHHYHVDLPRSGITEIDQLTNSFQEMISLVGSREAEINQHREQLEETVARRTAELHAYAKELEQSNEDLRNFVFIFHHDLRTPVLNLSYYLDELKERMSAVRAIIERCPSGLDRQECRRLEDDLSEGEYAVQVLATAVTSIKVMFQCIIDITRVSTHPVRVQRCEPETVIRDVIERFAPMARDYGATVTSSISCGALEVDPNILRQILEKLLDNAIRYCREGSEQRVSVTCEAADGVGTILIRDTGTGIASEEMPKIFDLFSKGDHKNSGIGMGLPMARALAKRMGADITAQSQPGQGATFVITTNAGRRDPGYADCVPA